MEKAIQTGDVRNTQTIVIEKRFIRVAMALAAFFSVIVAFLGVWTAANF